MAWIEPVRLQGEHVTLEPADERDIDERNRTLEIGGTWIGRAWGRTAINTEAKWPAVRSNLRARLAAHA